ncbi:MAG: type III-B CRISPR module-associated protein Cmr5 [Bacillota bacterium]
MQTRDQKYAVEVFKQVSELADSPEVAKRRKYGSMAHRLPILIRTAGLAQAVSFVESRGDDAQKLLLRHLGEDGFCPLLADYLTIRFGSKSRAY